jgi:hypothetical protein
MFIYNICMHKTIIFTNVLSLLQHSSENDCERVLPGCPIHGLKKPPWFGDDPCRGRFIGLPGVMCELCPCSCCKWGGELHTLSTLTGLSSGGMYCSPSMNSRSRTSTTWRRCCFASLIIGYRFFLLLLIAAGYCSLMPKEDPFNSYAFCSTICMWLWYIKRDTLGRALFVPRRPNRWMFPNSIYHNWAVLNWEYTTKNRKNTTILLIELMDLHKCSK